jgi:hypothetical protein
MRHERMVGSSSRTRRSVVGGLHGDPRSTEEIAREVHSDEGLLACGDLPTFSYSDVRQWPIWM